LRHRTASQFWDAFAVLPVPVRRLAERNFQKLKADPSHPSLHLKQVGRYWSVRVGLHHRAVAVRRDDDFVWFWVGTHAEYDRLIG